MGKFTLIILGIYILYYVGNIIYDLYLKKEKIVTEDDTVEYSLGDIAENVSKEIKSVEIDDVENLETPQSFYNEVINNENDDEDSNNTDMEKLAKKYEEEKEEETEQENEKGNYPNEDKIIVEDSKDKWNKIIDSATTKVKLLENIDGHKVYHIV